MKKTSFILLVILFGINHHLSAQTKFVILNDSTVYCKKDNADFIAQINNGKVLNKKSVMSILNTQIKNDTLLWNEFAKKIQAPIKPETQMFIFLTEQNNPDKSFVWFIKNKNNLQWISSVKSNRESNFFSIDPLVKNISDNQKIKYTDKTYKNIISNLSGFSGKIKDNRNVWKTIRDSLRTRLNTKRFKYKLVSYTNNNNQIKYIFISKINTTDLLPLYHFNSSLKTLKPDTKVTIKNDENNFLNLKDILFFIAGVLLTFLILLALFFLLQKRLLPLLISKNAQNIIINSLPELIKAKESKLSELFDKLLTDFESKFSIYSDLSNKLYLDNSIDKKDAFQTFLQQELEKDLKEKNNVKALLEAGNIKDKDKELQSYRTIFSGIQNSKSINDEIKKEIESDKAKIVSIIEKFIIEAEQCNGEKDSLQKNVTQLENEKDQISTDLEEKKKINKKLNSELDNYKESYKKIQDIINLIRNLEIEIQRFSNRVDNPDDLTNNILYYLMLLQTLLNLFYCLLSNSNKENQINNIKLMNIWNDDDVQKYIGELQNINLNDDLKFNIAVGDKIILLALYQKIHNLFDTDKDNFPKPFFFGIEDDMNF